MITIVVLASAFYSITLLMSEGDGIRILQTLPVRNIDLMYSKGFGYVPDDKGAEPG